MEKSKEKIAQGDFDEKKQENHFYCDCINIIIMYYIYFSKSFYGSRYENE